MRPIQTGLRTRSLAQTNGGVLLWRVGKCTLCIGLIALSIATTLFSEFFLSAGRGWPQRIVHEIDLVCHAPATQWIITLILAIQAMTLFLLERRRSVNSSKFDIRGYSFSAFLMLVLLTYAYDYEAASSSIAQLPVLLGGIVFGKAMGLWVRGIEPTLATFSYNSEKIHVRRLQIVTFVLVVMLTAAALFRPKTSDVFEYNGVFRWAGTWNNPNIFGLLMGVSFVLGAAMGFKCLLNFSGRWRMMGTVLFSITSIFCAVALVKSYARGAWFGTVFGLVYFAWNVIDASFYDKGKIARLRRNRGPILVIIVAISILSFWQFRFSEWRPARRVFSIANLNDFSWKNRIIAWRGAVQMMFDKPWGGYGWGKAEFVYNEKYCPRNLQNGAAIETNDYLMLGISAGVPVLTCFLIFLLLSAKRSTLSILRVPLAENHLSVHADLQWLRMSCRAGAIILFVGGWFDGALFKLATGSVFWTLLEAAREDNPGMVQAATVSRFTMRKLGLRSEDWVRRTALTFAAAAALETMTFLGAPFLSVNTATIALARKWLVAPKAIQDLNFLAANSQWHSRKLGVLLEHASLANYNRQLINWKLDDQLYRDYVLNPSIDPRRDGQFGWRRELWECFYLPVRKENDPARAAEIVLRFLHEHIVIASTGAATIEEMWHDKRADRSGLQSLSVAAFRSVGIPARLNADGRAELYSEGKWQDSAEYTR